MRYLKFEISNYRAIENKMVIDLSKNSLVPLVGINECGKTTILQAIYCFDWSNDDEYEGKHLTDIKNLYRTSEKSDTVIKAFIEVKYNELIEAYEEVVKLKIAEGDEDGSTNDGDEAAESAVIKFPSFPISKKQYKGFISIKRNLTTRRYNIEDFDEFSIFDETFKDDFCAEILAGLPYILYNDDFIDRPPTTIAIPNEKPEKLAGWLAIYEQLFNTSSKDFSLFSLINETDTRRIRSVLSDVKETVNRTLSKAWRTFLLSPHGSLSVDLNLLPYDDPENKCSKQLEIKIIEKIGTKERSFDVVDRSKGFLWFFNFVMKLEFNPKTTASKKDTIYLLDEPGSYLHYSAQEKLCKKLVDISQKHGNVIYCTHSHTLLNPALIPLNTIYIVEKDNQKRIKATPLAQVKTAVEDSNAYQPIVEALQISALNFINTNNPVIVVEGIYDKYAIELFVDLDFKVSILPGTSANSIVKNIQFLNAFNCSYIAIWDNDKEGRENYDKACKFYGQFECKKFDKLPLLELDNRRMERMFERDDIERIATFLEFDSNVQYEKIISTLYFSKPDFKKKVLDSISNKTKQNFLILKEIIEKRFSMKEEEESEGLKMVSVY
ncbi:MAG: hypothetical protein E6H09_11170 [Bacteroidetes bacterium]|jgi:predicted ATP-dependent endonuclease of OLD family|nr:MAG: hypothetical protein E6H09_11170 [Bacteroidota bacterium]